MDVRLNVFAACWPAGEKLSESSASDVRQLCTTLLNCYLIQVRAAPLCLSLGA